MVVKVLLSLKLQQLKVQTIQSCKILHMMTDNYADCKYNVFTEKKNCLHENLFSDKDIKFEKLIIATCSHKQHNNTLGNTDIHSQNSSYVNTGVFDCLQGSGLTKNKLVIMVRELGGL